MTTKQYRIHIEPTAHKLRKKLPGHVRQRIKRLVDNLVQEPRPHQSQALDTTGLHVPPNIELRRVRLEKWRIIYAVNDMEMWVWVWGIRQRPPYDYDDLTDFVDSL